ncbi:hypothetical protein LOZ61_002814 [Ophidiomyces ophidiicola]|nr:hypothetical protein LOZ61_002814 [Ophidiomyces ophidiicola]KAI1931007.1 hypothetical protein LOZ60_000441 [Ophidiomyces ophidiicola]KAI2148861.1 hypothetical protein LOZ27_001388 [Ophidiomyces ophidiicola]KAI2400175.1 hypothetical protein LOY90_005127 [Ophidiomyces ophidiicola]
MGPVDLTPWHRNELRALTDVKQTFSSWNACMQKAYCKWPAIIGIVLGSLVVLGIAWCIIGRKRSDDGPPRSKYADPPAAYQPPPPASYGFQQPAPPVYNSPAPNYSSPVPQYAQFDTPSKPVNEDALPHMPSWQHASTRRVEDTSQDLEMKNLNPSNTGGQSLGIIGRSHSGYAEVPSQPSSPRFAPEPYRGAELPSNSVNNSSIGVARTHEYNDQAYRTQSPVHSSGGMYPDASRPYPRSTTGSPPPLAGQNSYAQNPYAPYSQHGQQQSGYAAYSAPTPSSPPPPFSSTYGDNPAGRNTPGLLQPGRKPVSNSWKDV